MATDSPAAGISCEVPHTSPLRLHFQLTLLHLRVLPEDRNLSGYTTNSTIRKQHKPLLTVRAEPHPQAEQSLIPNPGRAEPHPQAEQSRASSPGRAEPHPQPRQSRASSPGRAEPHPQAEQSRASSPGLCVRFSLIATRGSGTFSRVG